MKRTEWIQKTRLMRFEEVYGHWQRGIYRRKIREKRGVFIERKSIENREKARKCWAFHVRHQTKYESSFVVNGGERGIRTLDTLLTYTDVPGLRIQPLCHLSKC